MRGSTYASDDGLKTTIASNTIANRKNSLSVISIFIFTPPLNLSSSQNFLSHHIFQDYFSYRNIPICNTVLLGRIQQLIQAKLQHQLHCLRDNIPTLI